MRCTRCQAYLSAHVERCPKCGMKFSVPPENRSADRPGRPAAGGSPVASPFARLRELARRRGDSEESFRLSGPLLATILVVVALTFGVIGWGVREYRLSHAKPFNNVQDAVTLVMRASAQGGGTVQSRMEKFIDELAKENQIEKLPGWSASCDRPPKCTVKFAYKQLGKPMTVAEWSADVETRSIQPENEAARQLTP